MYKDGGAGRGDTYKVEGPGRQERGQGSEDTDSEGEGAGRHELNEARGAGRRGGHFYLLANPRLAEAHNDSTVVPLTGADCSAPQPLPGSNLPHSQHLSNQGRGTYEGKGAGRQEQGQGSEDTDSDSEGEGRGRQGENYYLLAEPRLVEAHDFAHCCSLFRAEDPLRL